MRKKDRTVEHEQDGVITFRQRFSTPENEARRSSVTLPPYRRSFGKLANVQNRLECSEEERKLFDAFDVWRFDYVKSAMMKYSYRDLTSEALTEGAVRCMKQYITQAGGDGERFEREVRYEVRAAREIRRQKALDGYPALVNMAMSAAGEKAGVQVKKGGLIACALAGMEALGGRWTYDASFDRAENADRGKPDVACPPGEVISRGEGVHAVLMRNRILYLRLEDFNAGRAKAFERALRGAGHEAPVRGAVMDIRGNPGGYDLEMVKIIGMILGAGKHVGYDDCYGQYRKSRFVLREDLLRSVPMAILTDGRTISAAENMAATLKDHGRAFLVGEPTFGKGSSCNQKKIDDIFTFSVTTALFYPPSGKGIEGAGVEPDRWVRPDPSGLARDVALETALTELDERIVKQEQAEQLIGRIVKHDDVTDGLVNDYNEALRRSALCHDATNADEALKRSKRMTRAMLSNRAPAKKGAAYAGLTVRDGALGTLKAFLAEDDRMACYMARLEAVESLKKEPLRVNAEGGFMSRQGADTRCFASLIGFRTAKRGNAREQCPDAAEVGSKRSWVFRAASRVTDRRSFVAG